MQLLFLIIFTSYCAIHSFAHAEHAFDANFNLKKQHFLSMFHNYQLQDVIPPETEESDADTGSESVRLENGEVLVKASQASFMIIDKSIGTNRIIAAKAGKLTAVDNKLYIYLEEAYVPSAPAENPQSGPTNAHLQVPRAKLQVWKQLANENFALVFEGWMMAGYPELAPFDDANYNLWLVMKESE